MVSAIFCAAYRVWVKPNKYFWSQICKIRFKKLQVGTNSPCLLRLQMRKFLCRKITVRFKLNLKTDGLNCRMIFKFGKRIERLHSASKQCLRIYKDHFCIAKHLLGNPKPLNCTGTVQAMDFVNRGAGQLLHDALHILPARGLSKDGIELLNVIL